MPLRPGQQPEEAVRLLFVGEKSGMHPEEKHLPQLGLSIPVARLRDLVQMKLNSFRPKDEAHLEILDKCSLITPSLESDLPEALRERLAQARKRYSIDEFEDQA